MEFIDLNLQNRELEAEALKLGFSKAFSARIIELRNGKDLNSVNSRELISIQSNDPVLLRNCIKQRKPLLCNPLFARDFHRDEGLIREAAERETFFEIPISEFLKTDFVYRAKLINQTRNFIKRCLKLDAEFVFTSRAANALELKSPQEIIAIASTIFGLTPAQGEFAISKRAEKLLEAIG